MDLTKVSVVLPSLDPDDKLLAVIDGLLEYGFTDIKYNEDFSHIDFYVNATVYTESGDTMVQENLYAGSRMYQMYLGKDPKTIKMTFNTYDSETGEKVESSTYPDDLNH